MLRKRVDERANVQNLVTKQPIFVSKQNSIKKETPKSFVYTR